MTARGHQCIFSQQYSSVVHFARAKCLGGDVLKGNHQKPFQGLVDYDVIMWIDSDMVFKSSDFFALLDSPYDVTAGLYMMENNKEFAVVREWNEDFFTKYGCFKFLRPEDIVGAPQYIKVAYAGMGWMMIRKGVIESIEYPWFRSDLHRIGDMTDVMSEDVSFCRAIQAVGHDIYVDTKIRVGHLKSFVI